MSQGPRRTLATLALTGVLAIAGIAAGAVSAQTDASTDFTDWVTADHAANTASGTLRGVSVSLSGSDIVGASVTDGTFTGFAASFFSPALPKSDAIGLFSLPGHSYELTFGARVADPVIHLASFASEIEFPAGTTVTKVSGQDTLIVSGNKVTGAAGESGTNGDANGTVRVSGTFESLPFKIAPVPAAPNGDGLYLQIGSPTPAPQPTPTPTPTPTTPTPTPEPSPTPPGSSAPENVVAPTIVEVSTGAFSCDPGTWRNASSFTYRWLVFKDAGGETIATTQGYKPDASVYGYPVACEATAAGPDGPVTATSSRVFFSSGGLNKMPPAYGDVRVRGIDVFQVVQPTSGARMFGYEPDGAFAPFCGGGTPTPWRRVFNFVNGLIVPSCSLGGRDPQSVDYEGVVQDRFKPTWAAVYVDVAGAEPADPTLGYQVELSATAAGRGSLGEPVLATVRNPPRTSAPWVQHFERDSNFAGDNNRHAIMVRLPAAWTTSAGSVQLQARLRFPDPFQAGTAGYGVRQCDRAGCEANDTFTLRGVPFSDFPDLIISTLELRRQGDKQDRLRAPSEVLEKARRIFPGGARMIVLPYRADLDITTESKVNTCTTDTTPRDCRIRAVSAVVEAWIADHPARPKTLRGSSKRPRPYDVVMGVHDYDNEPGWATTPQNLSFVSRTTPRSADDTPYFTATQTARPLTAAAHELGHVLTAPHTVGCSAKDPEPWPHDEQGRLQSVKFTPPFTGLRGGGPSAGARTVDGPYFTDSGSLNNPTLFDLMSYCSGSSDTSEDDSIAWLSARNWNRFARELGKFGQRTGYTAPAGTTATAAASAGPARAAAAGRGNGFAVGVAGPSEGEIMRVVPPDGSDAVPPPAPSSPYKLRSLDAGGRVLLEAGVKVRPSSESSPDAGGTFTGPVAPKAAAVELVRDGSVLHRLQRSQAPTVRLLSPDRGTRVAGGGGLQVRWQASDPDRDELTATIDFSPDDGRTWRGVHGGSADGTATIPGDFLSGSARARVRVNVSDGFSETTVTSAPFTAVGRRPRVEILTPGRGALLRSGERVTLEGSALDDTGSPLTGRSLTWFAGRTRLGTGARLRTALPRGARRLRLVARDRTGRAAAATLPVRITTPELRIVDLAAPTRVAAGARSVRVRISVSASATLRAGGRRFRVGRRIIAVDVPLPPRPAAGVVTVPFQLKAVGQTAKGTIRGRFSVARA